MYGFKVKPSFLTRDHKLFLELTQAEIDTWLPRVFEAIRPTMNTLSAILFGENEPINLVLILDLTMDQVREVAREMANTLLPPERLDRILPQLNAYCDELLSNGHDQEAAFIQHGLIRQRAGDLPSQNPLLVEICAQSIYQQVQHMSQIGQTSPRAQ